MTIGDILEVFPTLSLSYITRASNITMTTTEVIKAKNEPRTRTTEIHLEYPDSTLSMSKIEVVE
jgi:hypothetical protein